MNKAMLAGIDVYPSSRLMGSVNDVCDMQAFLVSACGFKTGEIRVLVNGDATRQAIMEGLAWLLTGLKAGDRALFQFSGHGAQVANGKGSWPDGFDSAVCPYDFAWDGTNTIRDKEFGQLLKNMPKGVSFVWLSDSCHSGGFVNVCEERAEVTMSVLPPQEINGQTGLAKRNGIAPVNIKGIVENLNIVLLAACSGYQNADDMFFNGRPNGVFTWFLLRELQKPGALTKPLMEVVNNVCQGLLSERYSQAPQIAGPDELKNRPFLIP